MIWRARFLAWVTPILLLAQIALAIHQFEHRVSPDAVSVAHECVLCSVASGAVPPPALFVILPPDLGPAVRLHAIADAICCTHFASPFRARAPPLSAAL